MLKECWQKLSYDAMIRLLSGAPVAYSGIRLLDPDEHLLNPPPLLKQCWLRLKWEFRTRGDAAFFYAPYVPLQYSSSKGGIGVDFSKQSVGRGLRNLCDETVVYEKNASGEIKFLTRYDNASINKSISTPSDSPRDSGTTDSSTN